MNATYRIEWRSGLYTLSREVGGMRRYRLTKGETTGLVDYPVLYHDGSVGFDRPEAIARRVRARVERTMNRNHQQEQA